VAKDNKTKAAKIRAIKAKINNNNNRVDRRVTGNTILPVTHYPLLIFMSNNQQGDQKQGGQKQIRITDNLPGGEYANAMQINHNKEEFHLNFLNIMGLSGKVSGKIITNPSHFKRMIAAMQENLEKYESQYGKIEEAQGPINKEIGFKE
jgi:hypothetical protein